MKNRGGGGRLLLTRNPTKDFYPERPSGVKDLSRPANYSIESRLGRSRKKTDRRAGAFLQRMNHVDRQVFKSFRQPTGPAHLHPIDLGGGAEATSKARKLLPNISNVIAAL